MPNYLSTAFFKDEYLPFEYAALPLSSNAFNGFLASTTIRATISQESGKIVLFRPFDYIRSLAYKGVTLQIPLSVATVSRIVTDIILEDNPTSSFALKLFIYLADPSELIESGTADKQFAMYGYYTQDFIEYPDLSARFSSYVVPSLGSEIGFDGIAGSSLLETMTMLEATSSGYNIGLLSNESGYIIGAPKRNIFIVKRNVIYTPPIGEEVFDGITRSSVLEICSNLGFTTEQKNISKADVLNAEEIFLVGHSGLFQNLNTIEQQTPREFRPYSDAIRAELVKSQTYETSQLYSDWLIPLDQMVVSEEI